MSTPKNNIARFAHCLSITYNRIMYPPITRFQRDLNISIPKQSLVDGGYYIGKCRNSVAARWNQATGTFFYWRVKFGIVFIEDVQHPEDGATNKFDYFVPIAAASIPYEIPFEPATAPFSISDFHNWERDILKAIEPHFAAHTEY